MRKSVVILALGDIYWTRFAFNFSKSLVKQGINCVIVFESRVGEYQSYCRRCNYPGVSMYYLTDYINANKPKSGYGDISTVMCDYLRIEMLGQFKKLRNTNWGDVASLIKGFVDYVVASESIGLIIGDQVSTSLSYNFCDVAKKNGIEYWGISGSRLAGRYVLAKTVNSEDNIVKKIHNEIISGKSPISSEERRWAVSYIKNIDEQVPDYMRLKRLNSTTLEKFMKKHYFKSIVGSIIYTITERKDQSAIVIKSSPLVNIITAFSRNLLRWCKVKIIKKYFDDNVASSIKGYHYYVYPIHYQPEASTVIGSPYFTDQLNVIKNLAFLMPSNVKLVVKEHVSNVGFPSVAFYQKIKSIPNVILVWHDYNIKELIRNSMGVVTLTSTAGFEALLLGKKTYHFGDVFYAFHKNAKKLESWVDVRDSFLKRDDFFDFDNIDFLVAYKRYTHKGLLNFDLEDFGILDELLDNVEFFMCGREN